MRRAAKVDVNQASVVADLRAAGCTVQPLHAVGQGCPDILVGFRGVNYLFEIKDPSKPPSKRKLTTYQEDWHGGWKGQCAVALDAEAALAIIGLSTEGGRG